MPEEDTVEISSNAHKLETGLRMQAGKKYHVIVETPGMAWLAVQVFFHGQPLPEAPVEFFEAKADGSRGAQAGEGQVTDEEGRAALEEQVEIGSYVCAVEGQLDTIITTTSDPGEPVELVLPIGRPAFDYGGGEDETEEEVG
jgi:hypothetical protein